MAQRSWWVSWLLSFAVAGWIVVLGGILILSLGARIVWSSALGASEIFSQAAGRHPISVGSEMLAGLAAQPQSDYRFLILGTDEVPGSNRGAVLTDTILIATYTPADSKVRLLSLPRDFYLQDYQTKINALYYYSNEQTGDPTVLPTQALSAVLGVDFDHVVVVTMEDIAALIDQVGGIEVDVPTAFEDPLFPRSGVDVTTERDPAVLYETLRFAAGPQRMDGETAIKYVRTRHSADLNEGTDQARIRRQQQVISALVSRMSSEQVLANPQTLGQMYRWYSRRFARQVPLTTLGNIGRAVLSVGVAPQVESVSLPISDGVNSPDGQAVLVHPALSKYGGQWVYELADPSGEQMKEFIRSARL